MPTCHLCMMPLTEEHTCDLWSFRHQLKYALVIPTNGMTKYDGSAVMGAGLAKQATMFYPRIAQGLGTRLREHGNHVFWFPTYRVLTFPTKHDWREKASSKLIKQSAEEVLAWWESEQRPPGVTTIVVPRVGCGLGGLDWYDVRDVLNEVWRPHFRDRHILYLG